MANISFGERLKRARIRSGMTQTELGDKTDVHQTQISHWESGRAAPTKQQKEILRRILGGWASEKPTDETTEETEISPGALSAWLTRTRLEKKKSVPELAEEAGLSAPAIYNIESGRIFKPTRRNYSEA